MSVARIVSALEDAGVAVEGVAPEGARLDALMVSGVQQDSRVVARGDLFVAWAGASRDAHDYLGAAAAAGARAAIVERPVPGTAIPQLQVDNARLAAAVAAGFVAGSPWPGLRTAGVTGTNGKTTTALLLRGLLAREGQAAAIGTLGVVGPEGGIREDTGLTTPRARAGRRAGLRTGSRGHGQRGDRDIFACAGPVPPRWRPLRRDGVHEPHA